MEMHEQPHMVPAHVTSAVFVMGSAAAEAQRRRVDVLKSMSIGGEVLAWCAMERAHSEHSRLGHCGKELQCAQVRQFLNLRARSLVFPHSLLKLKKV